MSVWGRRKKAKSKKQNAEGRKHKDKIKNRK